MAKSVLNLPKCARSKNNCMKNICGEVDITISFADNLSDKISTLDSCLFLKVSGIIQIGIL